MREGRGGGVRWEEGVRSSSELESELDSESDSVLVSEGMKSSE